MNMCFLIAVCCVAILFLYIKNEITHMNRKLVEYAILCSKVYGPHELDVSVEDMEPYYVTLLRIADFGYENILPKNKFEMIKGYL